MRIYNTLSGVKEELRPSEGNLIKMYICGPTVYDHSHIGHGRVYVVYDILERYLRYRGYDVFKVINITDIDDKIIKRANELGISVRELAEIYIKSFIEDLISLKILLPEVMPRATHHISDMIKLIQKLIDKGYAYVVDGDVYFDVSKFEKYGELSKQKIEDLIKGYRIEVGEKKRNPADFALWKARKPGEPYWKSPWGAGRPGWHIECSVMSMKYLGETIDIHGGGADLIFPHHENEKAQSEAATGKRFVKIWMHVGLVTVGNIEMSKSKGNIITIKEVVSKYGYDSLRMLYITTHYRSPLEFTWQKLEEASSIVRRIRNTVNRLREYMNKVAADELNTDDKYLNAIKKFRNRFINALDDDLNTPEALSIFMEFLHWINKISERSISRKVLKEALNFVDEVLYIFGIEEEAKTIEYDKHIDLINLIVDVRKELRKRKIYDLADYIRSKLREMGIELEDIGTETIVRM